MCEDIERRYGLDRLPIDLANRRLADLVNLAGRVAVVVGGTGANLGRAIVLRLSRSGARVVIVGRNRAVAEQTMALARRREGADICFVPADAGEWTSIHHAAAAIVADFGRIDIWVNNLGGSRTEGPVATRSQADIEESIERNLTATIYATHAVVGSMIDQGSGRIINVSADGGKMSRPGLSMLCTTKAAVNAFTANLSREVGPFGVAVNAVCPGAMLGPERLALLRDPDANAQAGMRSANYRDNVLRTIGLTSVDRASTPDEVAAVIAFLVSDAASYIQGTAISVGGGMSA